MIALWLSRWSEATLAWSNGALNLQSDGEELANSTDYHQSADSQIHEATGRDTQPRLAIDVQSRFARPPRASGKAGSQDIGKIHGKQYRVSKPRGCCL